MLYATGPWHTPPNFPDSPAELCLVLLLGQTRHFRYDTLRYREGKWYQQNDEPLGPGTLVSRWAYIATSIERMSELPPPHYLPVESRLFVPGQHTEAENIRLLATLVAVLKREVEQLTGQLKGEQPPAPNSKAALQKLLEAQEHMYQEQLASRDRKLLELRQRLIGLRQESQRRTNMAEQLIDLAALQRKLERQRAQLAVLQPLVTTLKEELAAAKNAWGFQETITAQNKRIGEQRKHIADLERMVTLLRSTAENK